MLCQISFAEDGWNNHSLSHVHQQCELDTHPVWGGGGCVASPLETRQDL